MTSFRPLRILLAAAAVCAAAPAASQSCNPVFTDVPASDPFCADVEWIYNRSITQGCTPTTFCANDFVTRREMAAFLARLGQVQDPVKLASADATTPATISLTGATFSNVVCQTPDYAVTKFPRRAGFHGFLSGNAVADQTVIVDIVASFDQGQTWVLTRNAVTGATFPALGAASVAVFGRLDLDVGQTVRFGIAPTATGAQTSPSLTAYCGLDVDVRSRTGTASPLDTPPVRPDPATRAADAFRR